MDSYGILQYLIFCAIITEPYTLIKPFHLLGLHSWAVDYALIKPYELLIAV